MDAPKEGYEDAILGKVIDGCRVERKLGQGGMGVVYLAIHESLQQEFVLKILNPALTGSEDTIERFFREAQACAQLNHSGIVAIQNVGQDGDYFFIRMEYIEGVTLEDIVKEQGQLDWRNATQLMLETAEALSHAHQKGMIHRDIKPENIMFTSENLVKVMDFGLAKHVHSSAKVSVTGQIVGTPFFMSPEQAGGKPTDARSDIYSVGVTLYYLVTGVKPFNGKNLQEIFLKHFFYAPESPKIYNEALPDSLCEIVKRCLKKKKKERYQSAKALVHDLQQVLANPDAPLGEEGGAAGGGRAAPPSQAGGFEGGDQTMVAGGDGGSTVRVEEEGGATVRVGDSEGDGATVQVGQKRGPGGVQTVSFGTASQVFDANDDPDSTLDLGDDEPAHAGLDLPTSILQAAQADGAAAKPAAPELTPEDRARRKKKVIIAAAVLLVPLLLAGLMNLLAMSDYERLAREYEELQARPTRTSDEMEVFVTALDKFIGQNPLAPHYVSQAETLKSNLRDQIVHAAKKEQEEAERQDRERKRQERERERLKALQKYKAEADAKLAELNNLLERARLAMRKPGGGAAALWQGYVERARDFLERFEPIASDPDNGYTELAGRVEQVRYPVIVTSDPSGAAIYLDGQPKPQGTTAGVVMVRPGQPVRLRVERKGFVPDERVVTATGEKVLSEDFTLQREELEEPLDLGTLRVTLGSNKEGEPIVPVHPVEVVGNKGGLIYFVDRGGYLRGFQLRRGKMVWSCPDGPNCRGAEGGEGDPHAIGMYGDPTPRLYVVEGKVVLASSLLGRVTAHDPLSGRTIWSAELGSPVTTQPFYKKVFRMIAVGTGAGEVVLLGDQSGEVVWRYPTENAIVSTPFFWADRFCIAGSTDDRVYSLDWKAQRPVDELDLGSDVIVGPIPVGRQLLVGTAAGQLHLIAVDGEGRLSRADSIGDPGATPIKGVAVNAGAIFFTRGRELHAVDDQGQPLWDGGAFTAPGELTEPVVPVGSRLVFVGCANGVLYALNRETGQTSWRFNAGEGVEIHQPPVVFDQRLYVIAGGRIHVLHAE